MKLNSSEKALLLPTFSIRAYALLLLLLAGAGLCTTAFAASDTIVNCDRLESSLRSLDVPVDDLTNDDEDLSTADEAAGTTPVLQLTRRASTLSRDVFAALPIVVLGEDGTELDATATTGNDGSWIDVSPLVLAPATPDNTQPTAGQDAASGKPPQIPRFQRQMYRTDI